MIGILAGMGPKSTAPFIDQVIKECQLQYAAEHDTDFPPMMIHSLPAPFFIDRPLDHDALRGAILTGLKRLEQAGVEFIAMPCNTAHIYHRELSAGLRRPLLDMVAETIGSLPAGTQSVAVIASGHARQAGIYQEALRRAGVRVIENDAWRRRTDTLISAVKAPGRAAEAQERWGELVRDIERTRVQVALLACTDLNALDTRAPPGMTLVDSLSCLARATVRRWRLDGV